MKAMRPPAAFSGGGVPRRTLPTYQAAAGSSSRRGAGASSPLRSALGERHRGAEPRQPGIERDEIAELHADAAEPHGEARHFARRQHQRPAGLLEPRGEAAGADLVEHGDRRHVQRQLQGAAHRHRALEGEIEILRRIAAEADGTILDQRLGMDEAVLEAEPVDERLERRARRAHRRRHVDLAGAARVEIVGRGDAREHLAGRMIDGEDRDRDVGPERTRALARELLEIASAASPRW